MTEETNLLLGDKIANIMEKTGVASLTEKAAKAVGIDDCGCNKRRQQLNDLHKKVTG